MSNAFETRVQLDASPDEVFDHFVDPTLLVSWMGDYARLEASEGGEFSVDINGVLIRGHYVIVERPHRLEIRWGEAGNPRMPPGATRLRIEIAALGDGSVLTLTHDGLEETEAAKHAIGWPHFLARLQQRAAGGDPGPDPWARRSD